MNVNGNTHVGRQHDIVARADRYTNYFMRTDKVYLVCPSVLYLPVAYLVKKGCVECIHNVKWLNSKTLLVIDVLKCNFLVPYTE